MVFSFAEGAESGGSLSLPVPGLLAIF